MTEGDFIGDSPKIKAVEDKPAVSVKLAPDYAAFLTKAATIHDFILEISEKARREGLLAIEEMIDYTKAQEMDPLNLGLQLVVDGTDGAIIERVFDNLIEYKSGYELRLLKIIKDGVLSVQAGDNPRIITVLLKSHFDSNKVPNGQKSADSYRILPE
jgi:flagellar motor component MotA